ncbi:MAG: GNAT family N-acetyltransferase [Nitrososphaerales archaeon]
MTQSRILPATQEHHHSIVDCVESSHQKYVERLGEKPARMLADYHELISSGFVHVAVEGNILVGLIIAVPSETHFLIENAAVNPNHQRKGNGSSLMEFAIELAKGLHFKEVRLYTNELITENLPIYSRFGFSETDREKKMAIAEFIC